MDEEIGKYLADMTASPLEMIHKIIMGYSGVRWSGTSLREVFLHIHKTHATVLDESVVEWLEKYLMQPKPEKTPELVWPSCLQDLFSGIAGLGLPQTEKLLHDRLDDFRSWLRPLRKEENNLDPEMSYFSALAQAQTNQGLEKMWRGIALQTNNEPPDYIDVGLLGLLKTRNGFGILSAEVPTVLINTLIDLADAQDVEEAGWIFTVKAYIGNRCYSQEKWRQAFSLALETRPAAKNAQIWLKEL